MRSMLLELLKLSQYSPNLHVNMRFTVTCVDKKHTASEKVIKALKDTVCFFILYAGIHSLQALRCFEKFAKNIFYSRLFCKF